MAYKIKPKDVYFNVSSLRRSVKNAYDKDTGTTSREVEPRLQSVKKKTLASKLLRTLYGSN
jgi:hypothetical protein